MVWYSTSLLHGTARLSPPSKREEGEMLTEMQFQEHLEILIAEEKDEK
jgi:hypothetical protein